LKKFFGGARPKAAGLANDPVGHFDFDRQDNVICAKFNALRIPLTVLAEVAARGEVKIKLMTITLYDNANAIVIQESISHFERAKLHTTLILFTTDFDCYFCYLLSFTIIIIAQILKMSRGNFQISLKTFRVCYYRFLHHMGFFPHRQSGEDSVFLSPLDYYYYSRFSENYKMVFCTNNFCVDCIICRLPGRLGAALPPLVDAHYHQPWRFENALSAMRTNAKVFSQARLIFPWYHPPKLDASHFTTRTFHKISWGQCIPHHHRRSNSTAVQYDFS
jgi:hypothetical protein